MNANHSCVGPRPGSVPAWTDALRPREHGSWSLALEPVALGLLAAPSLAGGAVAVGVVAGFLARRPLKLVLREPAGWRRSVAVRALAGLAAVMGLSLLAAVVLAGSGWLPWLLPAVVAGGGFLLFDLRNDGREESAELLGATAFASVTGALAAVASAPTATILALLFAMTARALPTVLFVRARVRGVKTGLFHPALPLATATAAALAAAALATRGFVPVVLVAALGALWVRALVQLRPAAPLLRARTLGIQELVIGAAYVVGVGASWPAWIPAKP